MFDSKSLGDLMKTGRSAPLVGIFPSRSEGPVAKERTMEDSLRLRRSVSLAGPKRASGSDSYATQEMALLKKDW